MKKWHFTCVQLCTTADVAANNRQISELVEAAVADGAQLVSLPEAANILLKDNRNYPSTCVPEGQDTTLALCKALAAKHSIWLHAGSLLVKQEDGDRVWNRTYLIAPDGTVAATYDKLHTFDVALGNGADFNESLAVAPGSGAVVADLGEFRLGLSICYDIRFSYLFDALALAGANVLMIPASFSTVTGPPHWEALLKARAIETGCYVIAAAQCGTRDGVRVYGHSMIISPFGEVLAAAADDVGIISADIDLAEVERTRSRLPTQSQRRQIAAPRVVVVGN
ncbi:carbon-nitrogen hydrolase family protein [Devosia sp. 2618]|uniref:carbon-nitrogen hydrolase family protein n=1 Tax=Devosia sp. 2618 TaxID=3156454 RepID=UPI0033958D2B